MKLDHDFLDRLSAYGSIGKTLGMLIRPAFIAAPGKTLVWGDWAAIEARVLPWLAASPGAEKVLDIFRANDSNPDLPDIYKITAGELLGKSPHDVTSLERQSHGKVPTLSLGFGGALGALQKMAITYKVYFDAVAGQALVNGWRERNSWAREFWGVFKTDNQGNVVQSSGLWGAANMAIRNPGTAYPVGRVAFVFDPDYLGGTLFGALPCGRLLTYPDCRYRTRTVKDKASGEEREVHALWFRKGYGWSALWYGKFAENFTQATAGSILRETLVALELLPEAQLGLWETVGHTHDEAVLEVDDQPDVVAAAKAALKAQMEFRPDWRLDLPLTAEITENWYYSKDPTL